MAPNRRGRQEHQQNQGGQQQRQQQQPQRNGNNPNNGGARRATKCARPLNCIFPDLLIYDEDVKNGTADVVKVICNNNGCDEGNYMHTECFYQWQDTVLTYLSSTGRARSWSDRQRLQNLWTKKGYDLAFKACDCRCGKGHLRKDLDVIETNREKAARLAAQRNDGNDQPPRQQQRQERREVAQNNNNQQPQGETGKKKKKSKAKENLPTLSLSAPVPHPNDNHSRKVASNVSAPASAGNGADSAPSPTASPWGVPNTVQDSVLSGLYRPRLNSVSSNASGSSMTYSGSSGSPPSPGAIFGSMSSSGTLTGARDIKFQRKNSGGDRVRHNSTGNGFLRRTDFSSFNVLPRHKLNSYHIKMEDDGSGNDEIRTNIFAALTNARVNAVNCCLCCRKMLIYDRYPLVNGTFFVSPRQHLADALPLNPNCMDGPVKYLNAVCMHCLEGSSHEIVRCESCKIPWNGSTLVLGGCYNYDIFAATPCCRSRRMGKCVQCKEHVISEDKLPNYFSEFSNLIYCNNCGYTDFHLVKPVHQIFERAIRSGF